MTGQSVEVTTATTGDQVAAVVDLFVAYLAFYDVTTTGERVAEFLADRQERDESVLFLAWSTTDRQRILAGFAHVYPTFESLSLAPSWTLNDLYVDGSFRRRGVARALIDAVCDGARHAGAAYVTLETAHDNAAARPLYEDVGFAVDDEFVHYTLPLTVTR